MKDKLIKNIPNALTMSRIIASVGGALVFVMGNIPLATGLYVYGAVSDFFDGLAARKLNAFSEFGRKLDAFSDKIYAGSLLIPSILCGNLLMLIPLLMELKISLITLKSEKMGFKPATLRVGKIKTALLFPTMIAGLLSTISMNMAPLLWILLPVSTILQSKSITAYQNLLDYNIKKSGSIEDSLLQKDGDCAIESLSNNKQKELEVISNEKTDGKCISNSKPIKLVEELSFYITNPSYMEEDNYSINKPYVRTRKKK